MQQKVIKVPEKDLVIIELEGRLDAVSSAQVEKTVADLAAAGKPPHIIIDFTNVSYLSSAGLRVLLSTHKLLLRHNHKLICAAFTDEVLEIIKMAGFDRVLSVVTSVEGAHQCLTQQG